MSSKTKEFPIIYEQIQYRIKYNRKFNIHLNLKDKCSEARTKRDLKVRAVTGVGIIVGSMGLDQIQGPGVSSGVFSQRG